MPNDAPSYAKRFYAAASVAEAETGFGVRLDARQLRTPGGAVFVSPTRALAALIAEEWAAQGELVVPASMPVTQLAFAALDWAARRDERISYVVAHGQTDLCCHRADGPAALAAHQAQTWDPLVAWGAEALGADLAVVTGVIAAAPQPEAISALHAHAAALDDFRLTALAQATGVTGSALIAFALLRGRLDARAAFEAAMLDDLWSQKHWGEDAEAQARLLRVRKELEAIERFMGALESAP